MSAAAELSNALESLLETAVAHSLAHACFVDCVCVASVYVCLFVFFVGLQLV